MYEHFVNQYNHIFPFDTTLNHSLKPFITPSGSAVDLGCGTGRLVSLLSEMGMYTVGVDLDLAMIKKAREDYKTLQFFHMNMVDFIKNQQGFDLITCLGNTIAHLKLDELKTFFNYAKQALNKKGTILIQYLNYDKILVDRPASLKRIELDKGFFERHYTYHDDTIQFKTLLTYEDITTDDEVTLYPHTRKMLIHILDELALSYVFIKDFLNNIDDINAFYTSIIITL